MPLLIALIVALGTCLMLAPICWFLRPRRGDDVMQRACGDVPRLVRGDGGFRAIPDAELYRPLRSGEAS